MRAVVDSSVLISLARAGRLDVLDTLGFDLVVLDGVYRETVDRGLTEGYSDASAIAKALSDRIREPTPPADSVDDAVLLRARDVGVLLTDDLKLGRRARTIGVRWVRSADLAISGHAAGRFATAEARTLIEALLSAEQLSITEAEHYLEGLK